VTTLAFCGLGKMGQPMAARLLGVGYDVVVWNRTRERAAPVVERGANAASTPAEAAEGADAVLTMLATPEAVEEVIFGPDGLVNGMAEGATLIEMSTIGPTAVRRIRERLPAGVGMLDAPVLGSIPEATEGRLKVFVGGDGALLERWRPVLERLGTLRPVGALGAGASMKLVTNLCLGVLMTGLGEALALAKAFDLDQPDVLDVLSGSPIGVTARSKRSRIESDEWPPNFKLALAAKDMRLVIEEAEAMGLHLPVAAAAKTWIDEAEAAGLGDLDYSAVIKKILEL
jgi:3-hydroxyisobutyrate dehydrogenase-like beta-hydroxyacid dehydrogenase